MRGVGERESGVEEVNLNENENIDYKTPLPDYEERICPYCKREVRFDLVNNKFDKEYIEMLRGRIDSLQEELMKNKFEG